MLDPCGKQPMLCNQLVCGSDFRTTRGQFSAWYLPSLMLVPLAVKTWTTTPQECGLTFQHLPNMPPRLSIDSAGASMLPHATDMQSYKQQRLHANHRWNVTTYCPKSWRCLSATKKPCDRWLSALGSSTSTLCLHQVSVGQNLKVALCLNRMPWPSEDRTPVLPGILGA